MIQAENNKITLCGTVCGDAVFSHEVFGEKFYCLPLEIKRIDDLKTGRRIQVEGQLRSYNILTDPQKSKLQLQTFAREIKEPETEYDVNKITLDGYICKPPIYRVTPFSREIADILLAVNRAYGKSDYIPLICWGRAARYCQQLNVGDNIAIEGRLQSREYQKKIDEENIVTKVAYEVSVAKLAYKEPETKDAEPEENSETEE